MRELTTDLFVTIDGFAVGEKSPAYFGFHGADLQTWIDREIEKPQVIVMGRVTYELFSGFIPSDPSAESVRMTELPKIVFSKTLKEPLAWANAEVNDGELEDSIRTLKRESGAPLRTMGSVSLVKSLLKLDLIDHFRLIVFPLILGSTGRESIFSDLPDINLALIDSNVLDSKLVTLEYRPES